MAKKKDRDIEKGYSVKQMVAKLRRLADCLENGKQFKIQILRLIDTSICGAAA